MPVVEVERNGGRPVSEFCWPFELPVELDEISASILGFLFIQFEWVLSPAAAFINSRRPINLLKSVLVAESSAKSSCHCTETLKQLSYRANAALAQSSRGICLR